MRHVRLGVNVDHVATVRNARGGSHPDPVAVAVAALDAGADGITVHLREDRRHIRDDDVLRLKKVLHGPINLEMAATDAMTAFALELRPHAVCLVPERREEVTTEGGLDVRANIRQLAPIVGALGAAGIRVSMFIDPEPSQVAASAEIGARVVELHTGAYAEAGASAAELNRLIGAARETTRHGLECHAGHGLTFDNVAAVAAIREVVELNIGHFLIGDAILNGLRSTLGVMMDRIREGVAQNP